MTAYLSLQFSAVSYSILLHTFIHRLYCCIALFLKKLSDFSTSIFFFFFCTVKFYNLLNFILTSFQEIVDMENEPYLCCCCCVGVEGSWRGCVPEVEQSITVGLNKLLLSL